VQPVAICTSAFKAVFLFNDGCREINNDDSIFSYETPMTKVNNNPLSFQIQGTVLCIFMLFVSLSLTASSSLSLSLSFFCCKVSQITINELCRDFPGVVVS